MMEKTFIKIIFENNIFDSTIDIFSLPIVSILISPPPSSSVNHSYLRYENGADNPDVLRCDYNGTGIQYELIEFSYKRQQQQQQSSSSKSSSSTSAPSSSVSRSKRKYFEHGGRRRVVRTRNISFDEFKKEISWCIIKNALLLHRLDHQNSRYCYVNKTKGVYMITTSLLKIRDIIFDNMMVGGYMKVFSSSAKKSYIASLNYRNPINLKRHKIIHFDVAKYCQVNSVSIFRLTLDSQIYAINRDLKTRNDDDEKLKSIQDILCDEEMISD